MHLVVLYSFFREVLIETLIKKQTACRMVFNDELKLLDQRYLEIMAKQKLSDENANIKVP